MAPHLEGGVQGGLRRVNDEVPQREAEALRVLAEDQRAWALPRPADALPARPGRHRWPGVVVGGGRRETIPSPFRLQRPRRDGI